jgi:hypothetical protein
MNLRDEGAREGHLIAPKQSKGFCPDPLSPFPYKVMGKMLEMSMEPEQTSE